MKKFEEYFCNIKLENEGKIEPFSLGIGAAIGIMGSAGQAMVHYITNPDAVAFLGMAVLNGLLSIVLGAAVFIIAARGYSSMRKELLKIPEKGKK